MTVDIEGNLKAFMGDRLPGARYASFDYCFDYFQDARAAGEAERLASEDRLMMSCLQLGFYLVRWGMLRRRTGLLRRSMRELVPVVNVIAAEPASSWDLDIDNYPDRADELIALGRRIRKAYTVNASDVLVTKTMLRCLRFSSCVRQVLRSGFGCYTFCESALTRISRFDQANQATLDAQRIYTLDFITMLETRRLYPKAKIIDMT
jgi:hypothetical protein